MFLSQLWLQDFRNYRDVELSFVTNGLTVITGQNGQGKTNLLEALGYVGSLRSFRGAVPESLVRSGAESAIARGLGERSGRELLIETEIAVAGRSRALVNKQPFRKSGDLTDSLVTTVFSPDDLELVKDGPAVRRRYVDELLADTDRQLAAAQKDLDRVLRQRNTLLRQAGGRLSTDVAITLDVWDAKFTTLGEEIGEARASLVEQLQPFVAEAYEQLAGADANPRVGMQMQTEWRAQDGGKGLAESLAANRKADVARGVTTVGPHRDELVLSINGLPARSHASQGEQRTLALALRLAGHRLVTLVVEAPPILLLDDVFSELDHARAARLLEEIPSGQAFLTTATGTPPGTEPVALIAIENGEVRQ